MQAAAQPFFLLPLALALPFTSTAQNELGEGHEPIGAVDVEYWGRFDNCSYGDCSNVPDVLHGILRIDLSLAPPDMRPNNPLFGQYERPLHGFLAPGFVTASGQPLLGRSADRVIVADLHEFAAEAVHVMNHASITVDGKIVQQQQIEVGVTAQRQFGIEGDSLVQEFDVRTADVGAEGLGVVQEVFDGVARGYTFVIDRLRATPRVCRP